MGANNPLVSLLYSDVFEHAPFGMYTLDANGTINSFNPKMSEISGDRVDDAIGLDALHLESYKKVGLDKFFTAGLAGEPFETEVEYSSHIGHRKSYRHYRGVPIPDKNIPGQARLLLIVEDITDRKHIENELKIEEARLRASIDGLSMGYIMVDPHDHILMINRAAENIFNSASATSYTPENHRQSAGVPQAPVAFATIDKTLGPKANLAVRLDKSRKDHRSIEVHDIAFGPQHLNLYITPVITGGRAIGSVILIEDITEQKIIERSRDEFFSIASHELRTPLTAIRGNTSLIQKYYTEIINNTDVKSMISDIYDASLRLIGIVNDFLDMSRLEQGRLVYNKTTFDVVDLASSIMKEYDAAGLGKQVVLEVTHPYEHIPQTHADKDRVREILTNLIGNSLKFTEHGSIRVSFERQQHHIKISVTDTGRGIPEESQTLLFRKFQQAQTDLFTRDASRGTGLGLYISRMMARGMGGDVILERSEVNRGSTFSILLPVVKSSGT